ncbi:hypothetical protein TIFTF001_015421 [Ficus carica]|uniref:Uncharacterized protein n=1 Tax=Ficus carica TaxID=3494 RepID=A0AA88A5T2_FICCA|nr:hypothetical protein TIFTF001_015421 [Ficus carica]
MAPASTAPMLMATSSNILQSRSRRRGELLFDWREKEAWPASDASLQVSVAGKGACGWWWPPASNLWGGERERERGPLKLDLWPGGGGYIEGGCPRVVGGKGRASGVRAGSMGEGGRGERDGRRPASDL